MGSPVTVTFHPRFSDGSVPEETSSRTLTIGDPDIWVSDVLDKGTGFGFADFRPVVSDADLTRAADDDPDRVLSSIWSLFGLTPDGLVKFTGSERVRWSELARAADAGLIAGDVTNLVVYIDQGTAGGSAFEAHELVRWAFEHREQIEFGKDVLEALAGTAVTTAGLRKPVLALTKHRARALGREFRKRGYVTLNLMMWVDRQPRWSSRNLAGRLGLEVEEASALLREMGWRADEHGLFRRSHDLESNARRSILFANGTAGNVDRVGADDAVNVDDLSGRTWWDDGSE